jgi:hypothetical protein
MFIPSPQVRGIRREGRRMSQFDETSSQGFEKRAATPLFVKDRASCGQWISMVSRACLARCQHLLGLTSLPPDDALRITLEGELADLRREIQRRVAMQRYCATWTVLSAAGPIAVTHAR